MVQLQEQCETGIWEAETINNRKDNLSISFTNGQIYSPDIHSFTPIHPSMYPATPSISFRADVWKMYGKSTCIPSLPPSLPVSSLPFPLILTAPPLLPPFQFHSFSHF